MPVLRAGIATTVMSPAPGLEMEGYLRDGPSVGVMDELTCQAVVFDDGATQLVVTAADLIGITRPLRERVCAGLNLPPEQVMLTATHTHCGPGNLAFPGHEDLQSLLADRIIEAVTAATSALQPVRLLAGTFGVEGIAANRRDPDGPVDHDAMFLALISVDSGSVAEVVASIVNFACHPTILDARTRLYSADFPGVARQVIHSLVGGQAVYLQGAAGDINPVLAEPGAAEAHRTGTILGAATAREVLLGARSLGGARVINPSTGSPRTVPIPARCSLIQPAPLDARLAEVPAEPRRHPSLAAIRAAHAGAADLARRTELALEEHMITRDGFGSFDFPGRQAVLPVQAFRLGAGLSLIGLPGEPFTATGQQIRAVTPGTVLLAGYANEAAGYMPPRNEFERSGLEVGCSMYAPGTAERLADTAADLVRSFAMLRQVLAARTRWRTGRSHGRRWGKRRQPPACAAGAIRRCRSPILPPPDLPAGRWFPGATAPGRRAAG